MQSTELESRMGSWGYDLPYKMSGVIAPIYYNHNQAVDFQSTTAPDMDSKAALRSCTTCSKAKAKCVRRPGDQICERCARLKKECHSREPVQRRKKVVKATRAAQLEKLENKIEHLVNALATTQSQRGFSVDMGQPSPPISQASTDNYQPNQRIWTGDASNQRQQEVLQSLCEPDLDEATGSGSSSPSAEGTPEATHTQLTSPVVQNADYQSVGVSMAEADILLDRFRRLMAPSAPYVVIPPNMTAQKMYAEKPVLLHAIVVVASFHDLPKQQANVKRLLRNLSERILINCEKSIDILQAILIFAAWYHPHIFWSQQCTNLLHLGIAMIIDLGIDRPALQCGDFKKATIKAVNSTSSQTGERALPQTETVPTAEERRILAGIFYITSNVSSSFRKIDAVPWTSYLNNTLTCLETAAEAESDLFLVQMVRLQHLIEETSNLPQPPGSQQMYIRPFLSDLSRLRQEDPCESNLFLRLEYLITEVMVYELALNDVQESRSTTLRSRLDDICHLIDAIRAYLDAYFTIPISAYLTLPFAVFAQFAHAFVVLIKIASLEVEGWDFAIVSERLDFLDMVEQAAKKFEGAASSKPDGFEINNDHFSKWAIRIRWMKQVYEAKFVQGEEKNEAKNEAMRALFRDGQDASMGDAGQTPAAMPTPGSGSMAMQGQNQQQPTPPDDVLSGDFFNYLDENFWQSFAGDFDLGFPDVNMAMA